MSARYPQPGSANIWDTDLFEDSNVAGGGIPTGGSPVVRALHARGSATTASATSTPAPMRPAARTAATTRPPTTALARAGTRCAAGPASGWLDIAGFRDYVPGRHRTLRGAAVNIAAAVAKRIHWCALEGQDALEPDDTDGYSNRGVTGVPGGGWHLTRADAAGFERWLAYRAHADGLAILQRTTPPTRDATRSRSTG